MLLCFSFQSSKDLEEENQLLREEINVLKESAVMNFPFLKKLSLHNQIENLSSSLFSPTRCSDLRGWSMVATMDLINSNWFDFAQEDYYAMDAA